MMESEVVRMTLVSGVTGWRCHLLKSEKLGEEQLWEGDDQERMLNKIGCGSGNSYLLKYLRHVKEY